MTRRPPCPASGKSFWQHCLHRLKKSLRLAIHKLQDTGINRTMLLWLHAYLQKRRHCMKVEGQRSEHKSVQFGVPQGSVLGPMLFIFFINSVSENPNNKTQQNKVSVALHSAQLHLLQRKVALRWKETDSRE